MLGKFKIKIGAQNLRFLDAKEEEVSVSVKDGRAKTRIAVLSKTMDQVALNEAIGKIISALATGSIPAESEGTDDKLAWTELAIYEAGTVILPMLLQANERFGIVGEAETSFWSLDEVAGVIYSGTQSPNTIPTKQVSFASDLRGRTLGPRFLWYDVPYTIAVNLPLSSPTAVAEWTLDATFALAHEISAPVEGTLGFRSGTSARKSGCLLWACLEHWGSVLRAERRRRRREENYATPSLRPRREFQRVTLIRRGTTLELFVNNQRQALPELENVPKKPQFKLNGEPKQLRSVSRRTLEAKITLKVREMAVYAHRALEASDLKHGAGSGKAEDEQERRMARDRRQLRALMKDLAMWPLSKKARPICSTRPSSRSSVILSWTARAWTLATP